MRVLRYEERRGEGRRGRERSERGGMWHLVAVAKRELIQSPLGDQQTKPERDRSEHARMNSGTVRPREANYMRETSRPCNTESSSWPCCTFASVHIITHVSYQFVGASNGARVFVSSKIYALNPQTSPRYKLGQSISRNDKRIH